MLTLRLPVPQKHQQAYMRLDRPITYETFRGKNLPELLINGYIGLQVATKPKRKEPPAETGPSSHLEGTDTHTDTQEAVSVGGANTWLRAAVSASRREQKTFFATTENSLTSCNLQMLFPVCVASSTVTLVGKRSSAATYISVAFKAQKRKILKNVLCKENDANSKAEILRR